MRALGGLVKYLSTASRTSKATEALARLAIFSAEDEVRQAALDALKVRRERDYTAILVQGLRYPLPVVARRAADVLVKLERTDLVTRLVDLLDEPDPRAPMTKEVDGKKIAVVKELVRVNHHRSCLLCHAPGNTGNVAPETLKAGVPLPGEPLPQPSEGYKQLVTRFTRADRRGLTFGKTFPSASRSRTPTPGRRCSGSISWCGRAS